MPGAGATWRLSGAIARRPAVPVAMALIAGILTHNSIAARPILWLSIVTALLCISIWQIRRDLVCTLCLASAVFFVALAAAQLDAFFFPGNHIAIFTEQTDRLAELELRVMQTPRISGGLAEMRQLPLKQIVMAEVTAEHARDGWQAGSGIIVVSVEPPDDRLMAGTVIRAVGWLSRPEAPANYGQFDFARYDRRQRILAEFRVRRSEGIQVMGSSGIAPLPWLRYAARRLLSAGFRADHAIDAAFLRLLVLGESDQEVANIRDEFANTGTVYQLSISGLHIAILGGAVLLLMRLMRMNPRRSLWIAMFFVALYAVVALPSESGIRSLVVCSCVAAGVLGRRATDGMQSLGVGICLLLLLWPLALYDAGFQIGVAAVLSLLLLGRHVQGFFQSLWSSDDPWAGRDSARGALNIALHTVSRLAWGSVIASAVIWAAVMPLVAYHFNQTNPWAVPAGFVLLPFTIIALLSGIAKIVLTLTLPPFAAAWAIVCGGPAIALRHGVDLIAGLPGATMATAPPPPWVIATYYVLLLFPLIPWRQSASRWAARCAPILACGAFLLVPSAVTGRPDALPPAPGGRELHLTLLSIGAGQAAVVRIDGGQTFFVDCGSTTIPDVYRRDIHPFLQYEGIRRVDDIFLSHGDYDHICAASEIIADYHVPVVRLTPYFRTHARGNIPAEGLLRFLDTTGPPPMLTVGPSTISVGGGASVQVLWPPVNCTMNSNNCGMVLRLTYAGRSILFPADIQVPPEVELLKHPEQLKSDILVAPHHGSAESSTLAFIRAVDPKLIVASNDRMLTHKQLVFDAIAKPWPLYRTDRCGEIDVTLGSEGKIDVETFSGVNVGNSSRE